MADVFVLDVLLHGRKIGTLTRVAGDRTLFAFEEDYIADDQRPVLSLSFKGEYGDLVTDLPVKQTRVLPFFANLLPEGPLREYLATRAGINAKREFFLLWMLGQDLPGAIAMQPSDNEAWPPEAGDDGAPGDERAFAFRFSLAGVQLKFSAVMEATGGLTIPTRGVGGSWIVKLPSMRFQNVPENEFSMMRLAQAVGIDVPDVQLVPLDSIGGLPEGIGQIEGQALAVKRFDRAEDGKAVHIEDFAQVFGVYPERKYERASYRNMAEVIWAEAGQVGIAEFIRRLVFNTLIGNADMHLKNWSLIYPDQRTAALSPAYDFVSTISYIDDTKMALSYARSKKMVDLTPDELSYLAAKARLPQKLVLDTAQETVARFHEVWAAERAHLPLPKAAAAAIDGHIARLRIV